MQPTVSDNFIELDVIERIVKAITTSSKLDEVGQSIVDAMVKHLHSLGGGLLLVDLEKKMAFAHSASSTYLVNQTLKFLRKSYREHIYRFDEPSDNLIVRTIREKKILSTHIFSELISPEVSPTVASRIERLVGIKKSITLPVIMDNKIIGVLFICFREKEITAKQMNALLVFADLAAIAINNALKFEELQNRYKELNDRYELEMEITATLSHELKTPITIAFNSLENFHMVLDKYAHVEKDIFSEFQSSYTSIDMSVRRMDDICKSIFNLIDAENNTGIALHKLDLEHQLEQLLDSLKKKFIKKKIKFTTTLKINKGTFYGGGVQLEQVLIILLDNALKYTEEGEVKLNIVMDKEKIYGEVADSGLGIPYDKREDVFERFYRYRSIDNSNMGNIQGLGLGLFIAKKIISKLGGKIFIMDNENKIGTKFVFEIPIYRSIKQRFHPNDKSDQLMLG